LVVDEAEHGADLVPVRVEVRDQERVLEVLERARVALELRRHEVEVLEPVGAEAHLRRWARRTKPVRKVKRM
jgi:hypothetical protein